MHTNLFQQAALGKRRTQKRLPSYLIMLVIGMLRSHTSDFSAHSRPGEGRFPGEKSHLEEEREATHTPGAVELLDIRAT